MADKKKVSLTEKYLPKDVWNWLSKKTSYGTTVYDCVVSGNFKIFLYLRLFEAKF